MEIFIVVILIAASGMFSGLTIGLMGYSVDEVERLAAVGDTNAKKILPLVTNGNLLLTTLLLGNTAVNATLSIFLGAVVGGGLLAGFIATALILVFGEIIPAALLTRYALVVGGRVAKPVRVLMWLFYPIAGPIAMALDKLLGKELPELLSRSELCHVIETHHSSEESDIDALDRDILIGALSLNDTQIDTIMTPKEEVFTIDYKDELTPELVGQLKESGYTRFPVTWDDRVVGLLNIKRLVGQSDDFDSIEALCKEHKLIHVPTDSMADDVLYRMIRGKVHIAVISDQTGWVGIVTMEDLLETLVGQEITDEFGH